MPIADSIVEGAFKFVLQVIFEIVFFYTGEIILYVVSLGMKKPRWDYYMNERPFKWAIFTEISWWIGFFSWVFTVGWIARQLL